MLEDPRASCEVLLGAEGHAGLREVRFLSRYPASSVMPRFPSPHVAARIATQLRPPSNDPLAGRDVARPRSECECEWSGAQAVRELTQVAARVVLLLLPEYSRAASCAVDAMKAAGAAGDAWTWVALDWAAPPAWLHSADVARTLHRMDGMPTSGPTYGTAPWGLKPQPEPQNVRRSVERETVQQHDRGGGGPARHLGGAQWRAAALSLHRCRPRSERRTRRGSGSVRLHGRGDGGGCGACRASRTVRDAGVSGPRLSPLGNALHLFGCTVGCVAGVDVG